MGAEQIAATAMNAPSLPLNAVHTMYEVGGRPLLKSVSNWALALGTLGKQRKLALTIGLFLCFASYLNPAQDSTANLSLGKVLIGPVQLRGGVVLLEQLPEAGKIPRLCLVTHGKNSINDADLVAILDTLSKVLKRKKPFTVCWDFRTLAFPQISKSQFATIRTWVGKELVPWDTYAQAHVILVSNVIARGVLSIMLRIFKPPQPCKIAADEEKALDFAKTCCTRARSYVKASYDLAGEDKMFGGSFF